MTKIGRGNYDLKDDCHKPDCSSETAFSINFGIVRPCLIILLLVLSQYANCAEQKPVPLTDDTGTISFLKQALGTVISSYDVPPVIIDSAVAINDTSYEHTLRDLVKDYGSKGLRGTYYISGPSPCKCKAIMPPGVNWERDSTVIVDSVVISLEEAQALWPMLLTNPKKKWTREELSNARFMSWEAINTIVLDTASGQMDYDHLPFSFYFFSVPYFFRNGDYCLWFHGSFCGSTCGFGEFSIWRKDNGRWVEVKELWGWDS